MTPHLRIWNLMRRLLLTWTALQVSVALLLHCARNSIRAAINNSWNPKGMAPFAGFVSETAVKHQRLIKTCPVLRGNWY